MSTPAVEFDVEFDRALGTMVGKGMEEGLRLLSELHSAEADERRLATLLADATKRVTLARQNYERNRDLTKDIWAQLRQGIEKRRASEPEPEWDDSDLMCPNCVTPWKCNGPHLGDETPYSKRRLAQHHERGDE